MNSQVRDLDDHCVLEAFTVIIPCDPCKSPVRKAGRQAGGNDRVLLMRKQAQRG